MLSFRESFQRSANSSMLSPLLILTASNGIILHWCAGALAAAAGCEGESITLSTGWWVPGRIRSRSSSYVKSRGSVLGAYGLKSRIWPFERSRVRRKSKISVEKPPWLVYPRKKCRGFLYNLQWKSILAGCWYARNLVWLRRLLLECLVHSRIHKSLCPFERLLHRCVFFLKNWDD